jgi:hypothetical protein
LTLAVGAIADRQNAEGHTTGAASRGTRLKVARVLDRADSEIALRSLQAEGVMMGLEDLTTVDVNLQIQRFIKGGGRDKGRHPSERYASFDYCYNYFQAFREQDRIDDICHYDNMQRSCLELGFYLASWGMLRGSSFLLFKSAKFYESVLRAITEFDRKIWTVNVDSYTTENIALLLGARKAIRQALGKENKPTDILVTKIMLGVFGNIPAFDNSFRSGFGVGNPTRTHLERVAGFYAHHKDTIDAAKIYTLDFSTGNNTTRPYPKAKIVDMVGFMLGQPE